MISLTLHSKYFCLFCENFCVCLSVRITWVKVRGITYKIGYVVVLSSGLTPVFGLIDNIIVYDVDRFFYVCNVMETVCFSEHFHCFEVEKSSDMEVIEYDRIYDYTPLYLYTVNNTLYIPLKYHLKENV